MGRMYYLQIIEGPYYNLLAEGNRMATRPLVPSRGHIFDRNNIPLSHNESRFRIVLLTEKRDELEETLATLSTLIPLATEEKEAALNLIHKKKGLDTIIVKDNLTWAEVSKVELHSSDLPGLIIEIGSHRTYPENLKGAHLIGYVASPSLQEQEDDPMLTIAGLKVGKNGVEKFYDNRLRGSPGHSAFEVNAKRKIVRELHQTPSLSGDDIHLSIDSRLQAFAQDILENHLSGSVALIHIPTGEILALASTPSFDPNLFPQGITHKDWNELRDNPYVPMTNKALSGRYAPGSTVKLFVALAALEAGIIDKNTIIHCPGYVTVGNHKFHCMHCHGPVTVTRAITESCDVFFYEIAKKMGIDLMSEVLTTMGIGEGGLEGFPQNKKGLVPTKEWKQEHKNQRWTVSDTIMTSIGQGYMLSTPLELAVSMARLVSGKRMDARLELNSEFHFPELPYKKEHILTILEAANMVTNLPSGTAYRNRIQQEGFEMSGKTGTSQVRRITMEQRKAGLTKTHHLDWKYREHAIFIGYAPLQDPKYAIAVVIEHAGGSGPAVQVARDVLLKAQLLEREQVHNGPSDTTP
jgi:penicillin-binding protein 2